MNQREYEGDKQPYSCMRCRKHHRKCDRNPKGCSNCGNSGVKCIYADQLQNSQHQEKKDEQSQQQNTQQQQQTMTPQTLVDVYFSILCGTHPLIEKEKFKYFVNNCLNQYNDIKANEWISSVGELRCIHCFYMSNMSLALQLTSDINHTKTIGITEALISSLEKEQSHEFYWVASCFTLVMYFIGEGDFTKVNHYNSKVFEYLKGGYQHKFTFHLLRYQSFVNSGFVHHITTMQSLIKDMCEQFFYSTGKRLEDCVLPGTIEHMRSNSITMENNQMYRQVHNFVSDTVVNLEGEMVKQLIDCHSTTFFKHQRIVTSMIRLGCSLMLFKQSDYFLNDTSIEETALMITLLTEDELFPFCMCYTISPIVETCIYHKQLVENCIERGTKPMTSTIMTSSGNTVTVDYLSILKKDLKALISLAKRFKRVTLLYQNLIEEMTQTIMRNTSRSASSDTRSTTSSTTNRTQIEAFADDTMREVSSFNDSAVKMAESVDNFFSFLF
ncbi:predicted protein [Naegleria gruberi]|uniref:Predicted protein n=1 Tax=Naegleria gruberi TaxID=5762 RepID=D2W0Y9_NAEGR|nr:uncharacterized protein NAEGRDRAFT_81978 [Naegleria gruberi]EFC37226.1 predicted protein [Naegleria gruberi]|eukprot:XP_002669970.1 predicted protein [Naegleria gruberi strain NEG-M]